MDCQNTYYELGDYAHDLIRSKARTLIGKAGFTSADCEDIEQELALDLLVRLENYDPRKSKRSTFMARVVEHRIATLLEERRAACRDWRLCRESLDDPEWQERDEGARKGLGPDSILFDPNERTSQKARSAHFISILVNEFYSCLIRVVWTCDSSPDFP